MTSFAAFVFSLISIAAVPALLPLSGKRHLATGVSASILVALCGSLLQVVLLGVVISQPDMTKIIGAVIFSLLLAGLGCCIGAPVTLWCFLSPKRPTATLLAIASSGFLGAVILLGLTLASFQH
jgi:hypothetical protein